MRLRNAASALATRMRVREQRTPRVAVAAMDYPIFLRIESTNQSALIFLYAVGKFFLAAGRKNPCAFDAKVN
jgi:hypothetical protein